MPKKPSASNPRVFDIVNNGIAASSLESNFPYPLNALANRSENVRVSKEIARFLLLHQTKVTQSGVAYPLQFKEIGLGLYHVKLLPQSYCSCVVKEFVKL
jgi:hypothetical protein